MTETVKRLFIEANRILPKDVRACIRERAATEPFPSARDTLNALVENFETAERENLTVCQDTGLACVFLDIGEGVHIEGNIWAAVDEGVRRACTDGFLRASVVGDPLNRRNTGDNTPALLYVDFIEGDALRVTVAPKGAGSENMSRLAMLSPADGLEGVVSFVVDTVRQAGANPCPPIVAGVGIGGNFDKAALLAKKALLRPLGSRNGSPFYAALEERLLNEINALGIGPAGFGGETTTLSVAVETMPTHIAGLPVAVNINCHVARHAEAIL